MLLAKLFAVLPAVRVNDGASAGKAAAVELGALVLLPLSQLEETGAGVKSAMFDIGYDVDVVELSGAVVAILLAVLDAFVSEALADLTLPGFIPLIVL